MLLFSGCSKQKNSLRICLPPAAVPRLSPPFCFSFLLELLSFPRSIVRVRIASASRRRGTLANFSSNVSPFPTPLTTLSPRFAFRSFAFLFSRPELLLFSIVLNRRNDRCVPLFRRPTSASPRRKEEKKESVVGTMPSNDLMLISGSPAFSDSYCNDFLFDPFAYPSWLSLLLVCVQPVDASSPLKFSRFLLVFTLIFSSIVSPKSNTGFDWDHFWKSIRNLDNLPFICVAFSLSFFFCIRKNISSSSRDILIIGINYSGLYREPFQSKQ